MVRDTVHHPAAARTRREAPERRSVQSEEPAGRIQGCSSCTHRSPSPAPQGCGHPLHQAQLTAPRHSHRVLDPWGLRTHPAADRPRSPAPLLQADRALIPHLPARLHAPGLGCCCSARLVGSHPAPHCCLQRPTQPRARFSGLSPTFCHGDAPWKRSANAAIASSFCSVLAPCFHTPELSPRALQITLADVFGWMNSTLSLA